MGSLQVCYLASDGHRGFFLFFPPAVVFSTPIHNKEKILARISSFFLCLHLVSSDLAEIFSPAPGVSVLAQILAVGITVLLALIWAFRFKYDSASRYIADDRCTL